jgi:hypothetical protein
VTNEFFNSYKLFLYSFKLLGSPNKEEKISNPFFPLILFYRLVKDLTTSFVCTIILSLNTFDAIEPKDKKVPPTPPKPSIIPPIPSVKSAKTFVILIIA